MTSSTSWPDGYPPALVQAPARAGIGLHFDLPNRRIPANWPEDWWQRNYDLLLEPNAPDPIPLTERQMRIPPAPTTP